MSSPRELLEVADGHEVAAAFRASLDTRQPWTSNAKGEFVFRVVSEPGTKAEAWALSELSGEWFYVVVVRPEGRSPVVPLEEFERAEAEFAARED